MDLDALDTAYGAEQIDSDLLLTDIRTGLEGYLRFDVGFPQKVL